MAGSTDLEIQLLRKSVGALQANHQRCVGCGRTPLTGERLYVYDNGRARTRTWSPVSPRTSSDPSGSSANSARVA